MACTERYEVRAMAIDDERISANQDGTDLSPAHRIERRRQLVISSHRELLHFQPERTRRRLEPRWVIVCEGGIPQDGDPRQPGHRLLHQFELLPTEVLCKES